MWMARLHLRGRRAPCSLFQLSDLARIAKALTDQVRGVITNLHVCASVPVYRSLSACCLDTGSADLGD